MMDPNCLCDDDMPAWPPERCDPPGMPYRQYSLQGPQVEPSASYWTDGDADCNPSICTVRIDQIKAEVTNILGGIAGSTLYPYEAYLIDYIASATGLAPYPTNPTVTGAEIEELIDLASRRDDPQAVVTPVGVDLKLRRLGISRFLQLRPAPLGAIYNRQRANNRNVQAYRGPLDGRCIGEPEDEDVPLIATGRELARYFEAETPGLAHRQALNFLMAGGIISPPRQALVWMALDVAIYSALAAAWYFKWRADETVSRRVRPIECDPRVNVLFNSAVDCDGNGDGARRLAPLPSPGTPRHPAYPSGHSTYSAAASEICSYFFPDWTNEFDKLANNAGTARLWAGVHWRSDHLAGEALGRIVGRLVIKQIRNTCIPAPPRCECDPRCQMPPTIPELDACLAACCQSPEEAAQESTPRRKRRSRRAEAAVTTRRSDSAPGVTAAESSASPGSQEGGVPQGA